MLSPCVFVVSFCFGLKDLASALNQNLKSCFTSFLPYLLFATLSYSQPFIIYNGTAADDIALCVLYDDNDNDCLWINGNEDS